MAAERPYNFERDTRPHSHLRRATLSKLRGTRTMSATNKVLVTGASGLLGVAAIEKFLSAGWEVVGGSRRKPELPSGRDIDFLSLERRANKASRRAFGRKT